MKQKVCVSLAMVGYYTKVNFKYYPVNSGTKCANVVSIPEAVSNKCNKLKQTRVEATGSGRCGAVVLALVGQSATAKRTSAEHHMKDTTMSSRSMIPGPMMNSR
jgi:hypothetical protein